MDGDWRDIFLPVGFQITESWSDPVSDSDWQKKVVMK